MEFLCNEVESVEGLMGVQLELGEVKVAQGGVIVLERGWVLGETRGLKKRIRFRVKKKPEEQAGSASEPRAGISIAILV